MFSEFLETVFDVNVFHYLVATDKKTIIECIGHSSNLKKNSDIFIYTQCGVKHLCKLIEIDTCDR